MKLMRATKKTSKKNIAGKKFFISSNELVFYRNDFLSTNLQIGSNSMGALGRKKTHVFFGIPRPKSNARAHLKQWPKAVP